jgi:hypothetical protein
VLAAHFWAGNSEDEKVPDWTKGQMRVDLAEAE